ncbi:MAG: DUF4194 domain-containing protein [Anaerolineaceae bacterium]|nr:MAG: DUF4194 domain-containing protein [Anaerolineaceae bacterium]
MFDDISVKVQPYAAAIRQLLKGAIYHDDHKIWSQLRDYETPVRDYLAQIGLELYLDEIGGFAYLTEGTRDDDGASPLPALIQRRALSFPATLLMVLLRERLDEHEMRDLDGGRLRLSADDISEMMMVFMGEQSDARKQENAITSSVKALVRYNYLKQLPDDRYEVLPIIRARFDGDMLTEIKARLQRYITGDDDEADDADESI